MGIDEGGLGPTRRFSDRADYYLWYRPRYPKAVITCLQEAVGLSPDMVVADIGSGTAFLAELFLEHGNEVFAVEPNEEMRVAAELTLGNLERFHSMAATAEETTLPDDSVDLVTAGQAFHWFDVQCARCEFQRILHPHGWVAVIYNSWNIPDSPLAEEYLSLVNRYGVDYGRVNCQRHIDSDLLQFFGKSAPAKEQFENPQTYDFDALRGRVLSSSYAPLPGHPNYEPMMDGLRKLFEKYAAGQRLSFPYRTTVYWGQLTC